MTQRILILLDTETDYGRGVTGKITLRETITYIQNLTGNKVDYCDLTRVTHTPSFSTKWENEINEKWLTPFHSFTHSLSFGLRKTDYEPSISPRRPPSVEGIGWRRPTSYGRTPYPCGGSWERIRVGGARMWLTGQEDTGSQGTGGHQMSHPKNTLRISSAAL